MTGHPPPPPQYAAHATAYSEPACDRSSGGTTTASGTHVHFGEVAQSTLRLGTWIKVWPAIFGRRYFRIEDHFGSPQAAGRLDVWMDCRHLARWNNPLERWSIVHG